MVDLMWEYKRKHFYFFTFLTALICFVHLAESEQIYTL